MTDLLILSTVQGITEFLPISSSAHLILFSKYFNLDGANLTLDISLHLGSLLAILFYFKKELRNFSTNKSLIKKIILTSVPTTLVGFFLIKFSLIEIFRNYEIIGWSTIFFGIILFISDFKKPMKKLKNEFDLKSLLVISFFQILSLIPGVSRSGIVLTASRFLSFDRIDSAKISFLTAIPILTLVSIYNLQKIILQNNLHISINNLIGIILSFIISYLTIKVFINFLKKFNLLLFVIYRVILGSIILLYVYF